MVVTLNWHSANILPKALKKILEHYQFVFNPSYINYNNHNYLAVRVYCEQTKSIIQKLYIWNEDVEITEIDLSQFFNDKLNLNKVADTKLFIMNNEIWGTFNSGYEHTENNKLVLFKIEGLNVSDYYSCDYKDRARVEKNWAFYYHENELYALYNLNGLKVLKATSIEKNKIVFESHYNNNDVSFGAYSIGTPLSFYKGNYIFMAHRKIVRKGKRLYLGKPFLFKPTEQPQLIASNKYVIHSLKSLFGAKHKFNRFLISCTYFSGIHILKNKAIISYGINDVSWKIAKINISRLWR